jgi:hypothetical protein
LANGARQILKIHTRFIGIPLHFKLRIGRRFSIFIFCGILGNLVKIIAFPADILRFLFELFLRFAKTGFDTILAALVLGR